VDRERDDGPRRRGTGRSSLLAPTAGANFRPVVAGDGNLSQE
jgi:hypothetical protein